MKSFYEKETYSNEDILNIIETESEESIYLEFKDALALEKTDKKRMEISKDVAAFANSDGGIIIYGIKEASHKADQPSFINGDEYTKEWLEQVINSGVQRHIRDLRIFPMRIDNDIHKTIYIVKIPKSLDAPHISKDKRFYKRFNFESVSMEEFEVRQLYGRKVLSKLCIYDWGFTKSDPNEVSYTFEISIYNEGDVVESMYKLNLYLSNFESNSIDFSWDKNNTHYDYTWLEKNLVKISSVGTVPIYPSEKVNSFRINFSFKNGPSAESFGDVKVKIMLFYSAGEDEVEFSMRDLPNFDILGHKTAPKG